MLPFVFGRLSWFCISGNQPWIHLFTDGRTAISDWLSPVCSATSPAPSGRWSAHSARWKWAPESDRELDPSSRTIDSDSVKSISWSCHLSSGKSTPPTSPTTTTYNERSRWISNKSRTCKFTTARYEIVFVFSRHAGRMPRIVQVNSHGGCILFIHAGCLCLSACPSLLLTVRCGRYVTWFFPPSAVLMILKYFRVLRISYVECWLYFSFVPMPRDSNSLWLSISSYSPNIFCIISV